MIYDVFKADDSVFNSNFKLDFLFVQADVFNLELTVIFFYFLRILEDFIDLLINIRLWSVHIFCDLESATLNNEKMGDLLPLKEQVRPFYRVARLEFRNQLFYFALVQILEKGEALQVVLFFVFYPCVVFKHYPVEILFADDKNVAVSCRKYRCRSWLRIKEAVYTKVIPCGQFTYSENFRLDIV